MTKYVYIQSMVNELKFAAKNSTQNQQNIYIICYVYPTYAYVIFFVCHHIQFCWTFYRKKIQQMWWLKNWKQNNESKISDDIQILPILPQLIQG